MIGDIAAAVGGVEFDIHLPQQMIRRAQVFPFAIAPQSDDVRMLTHQQDIRYDASFARRDETLLQLVRGCVWNEAQINYPAIFHHRKP
jgi:hypothetical protein